MQFLPSAAPADVDLCPQRVQRMRAILQDEVERKRIPGVVWLLARRGRIGVFDAVGVQDPATSQPMARDAIFRLYSMTKPIVSVAAMMLMEQGRFLLCDPVARYLPEFADQQVAVERDGVVTLQPVQRPATVQDLLRHTAGLTYEFSGASAVQRMYREQRLDRRVAAATAPRHPAAGVGAADVPAGQRGRLQPRDRRAGSADRSLERPAAGRVPAPECVRAAADAGHRVPCAACAPSAHRRTLPGRPGRCAAHADGRRAGAPRAAVRRRRAGRDRAGLRPFPADAAAARRAGRRPAARAADRGLHDLRPPRQHPGQPEPAGAGEGFGLGFAVRTQPGVTPVPGSVGTYYWSGMGGTSFFVDPVRDLFAVMMVQGINQRSYYRQLFRNLVYATLLD
jgi:CubicO group peptidase (beta-lactamase class C family)